MASELAAEETRERYPTMTDDQYQTLSILLETKKLTFLHLQLIDEWLTVVSSDDQWDALIEWLNSRPDIELKPRRRWTREDYQRYSLG
jgi:hypothetical protein